jgi:polygalacturonase
MLFFCVFGVLSCQASSVWCKTINVVADYGADRTGVAYATVHIQNAIDACVAGDTVLIPQGTYLLNNGLTLKSGITVIIAKDALLQANTVGDWTTNRSSIVDGKGLDHVTVTGGGKIDGGGLVYTRSKGTEPGHGMRFSQCSDITVRDISVSNIPTFGVDFENSKNLTISSLTIRGRGFDGLRGSSDGMDIQGCANVAIDNCNIEVGDDALCLKTIVAKYPCHNVRIRNCTLASTCNGFKIGTGTVGDVYDVVAEDVVVNKHSHPGNNNPVPSNDCIAAIAIESNDHHSTRDITCRNFTINSCYCPIFIELQNRQSYEPGPVGTLDNILIENVNCIRSLQPIIFNWQEGQANKMTNVTLRDVTVHDYGTNPGGNLTAMTGGYPDANKNGLANAYGIWARGINGLKLQSVKLYDDGGSHRQEFVYDPSVQNVDSSAIGK